MKKGDIVTIYKDPITKQKPEGKARLVKFVSRFEDEEHWMVSFLDEEGSETYYRIINNN